MSEQMKRAISVLDDACQQLRGASTFLSFEMNEGPMAKWVNDEVDKLSRLRYELATSLSPSPEAQQPSILREDERAERSGVYVASRASVPERSAMWRSLRAAGMPINASWIDEAGEGETGDFSELWSRIEAEIRRSVGLILYAEASDFPLKGAYIEAGIAIGYGIPVCVVLSDVILESRSYRPLGSWAKHPLVSFAGSVDEAYASLSTSPVASEERNK